MGNLGGGVYAERDLKSLSRAKRKQLKNACFRIIKSNAKIKAALKKKLDPTYRRLKDNKA